MKLFLTSAAHHVMDRVVTLLPKSPSEYKVAFIPTAGDPFDETHWIEADRSKLIELGFKVEDCDIKNKTEQELREKLSEFDIIFVAGGNTFYLLDEVKKSGFDKVVKELVQKSVIYIGSSAGSYIACPSIEMADWKHKESVNIVGLKDFTAMGLINFLIIAHYEDKFKEAIEKGKKTTNYPVITLTDNQFIAVNDKDYKVITV